MKINIDIKLLEKSDADPSEAKMFDEAANEETQVQISPELGVPGSYKLYIHQSGRTVVRICKLKNTQIEVNGSTLLRRT